MEAIRYHDVDRPIVHEEVPAPPVGVGEVRVAIEAASLCGSDVHYRESESEFAPRTTPLVLGHEGAGTVTEVGPEVSAVSEGEQVIVHYVAACGHCERCMAGTDNRCRRRQSIGADIDGTLAEEIVIPERCAISLDPDVPAAWGSIMGCAGATAFHAVERSGLSVGDTVAIFGAGGVGLNAVRWADVRGAEAIVVVEPVPARRSAATEIGATRTVAPDADVRAAIDAVSDGWGVDVAIECSGSPDAMAAAVEAVDGRNRFESGTVVSVGIQETPMEATFWGLREGAVMVSGDHTRRELRTIADLMAAGRIDPSGMIADRIGLADVDAGLERIAAGDVVGRLIVEP